MFVSAGQQGCPPPGEVIAYSNYGTTLAGYIVEVVSGIAYAQYIEDNIYKPLGMENSTFRQPPPADLVDNMSRVYRLEGEYREARFEFMQEPSGSMSSSASDMARFMLAYLQGGQFAGKSILVKNRRVITRCKATLLLKTWLSRGNIFYKGLSLSREALRINIPPC
jgi:CubicO group peptidase (beta-lactamase class C family)